MSALIQHEQRSNEEGSSWNLDTGHQLQQYQWIVHAQKYYTGGHSRSELARSVTGGLCPAGLSPSQTSYQIPNTMRRNKKCRQRTLVRGYPGACPAKNPPPHIVITPFFVAPSKRTILRTEIYHFVQDFQISSIISHH